MARRGRQAQMGQSMLEYVLVSVAIIVLCLFAGQLVQGARQAFQGHFDVAAQRIVCPDPANCP